jgi:hypothetical protein
MSDGFEAEDEWRKTELAAGARRGYQKLAFGPDHGHEPGVEVPCKDCGAPVLLSPWAYAFLTGPASETCVSRGEQPIADEEMARCAPCHERWRNLPPEPTWRERMRAKLGQAPDREPQP